MTNSYYYQVHERPTNLLVTGFEGIVYTCPETYRQSLATLFRQVPLPDVHGGAYCLSTGPVDVAECSSQASLVAATTSLMLLNAGLCVAFALFYRVRKKQWSKAGDLSPNFSPVQVGVSVTVNYFF